METNTETKKCSYCNETKSLREFKYTGGYGDKHAAVCKSCRSETKNTKYPLQIAEQIKKIGIPWRPSPWQWDKIKKGIEKFNEEYGHYPTVREFDSVNYLPSAGTISSNFGGIVNLRKLLGYSETHLGTGKYRLKIVKEAGRSGLVLENRIEKILVDKFKEPYVHSQKRFMNEGAKFSVDFFVYSPSINFAVDCFHSTLYYKDVVNNINTKARRYEFLKYPLIIVVESEASQDQIDLWIKNKSLPLPDNFRVLKLDEFIKWVDSLEAYPDLPS